MNIDLLKNFLKYIDSMVQNTYSTDFLKNSSSIWLCNFIYDLKIWDKFDRKEADLTQYTKRNKKIVSNHSAISLYVTFVFLTNCFLTFSAPKTTGSLGMTDIEMSFEINV